MIIGTLRVRLLLRDSRSLKDKRQVVKSIKDRLRNHFNVTVAEIEAAMRERQRIEAEMIAWLDATPQAAEARKVIQQLVEGEDR